MKKILLFIIIGAMSLFYCACGATDTNSAGNDNIDDSVSTEEFQSSHKLSNKEKILLDDKNCKVTFSGISEYRLDESLDLNESSEDSDEEYSENDFIVSVKVENKTTDTSLAGVIGEVLIDGKECSTRSDSSDTKEPADWFHASLDEQDLGMVKKANPDFTNFTFSSDWTCEESDYDFQDAKEITFTLVIVEPVITEDNKIDIENGNIVYRESYTVSL